MHEFVRGDRDPSDNHAAYAQDPTDVTQNPFDRIRDGARVKAKRDLIMADLKARGWFI